jgi:hypothetical protein
MARGVPGFSAVPEENVVMAGVRKVDVVEQERLDASEVAVVGAHLMEKQGLRTLAAALDDLKTRVSRVYVHVDLDVLDARKVGKANEFAAEDGRKGATRGYRERELANQPYELHWLRTARGAWAGCRWRASGYVSLKTPSRPGSASVPC